MDEKYHEQASALEQAQRDEALRVIQALAQPNGSGRADCQDCGDPIPRERRSAVPNAIRCAACQTIFESKGKRHVSSR